MQFTFQGKIHFALKLSTCSQIYFQVVYHLEEVAKEAKKKRKNKRVVKE